jgi:hypothetical protein
MPHICGIRAAECGKERQDPQPIRNHRQPPACRGSRFTVFVWGQWWPSGEAVSTRTEATAIAPARTGRAGATQAGQVFLIRAIRSLDDAAQPDKNLGFGHDDRHRQDGSPRSITRSAASRPRSQHGAQCGIGSFSFRAAAIRSDNSAAGSGARRGTSAPVSGPTERLPRRGSLTPPHHARPGVAAIASTRTPGRRCAISRSTTAPHSVRSTSAASARPTAASAVGSIGPRERVVMARSTTPAAGTACNYILPSHLVC